MNDFTEEEKSQIIRAIEFRIRLEAILDRQRKNRKKKSPAVLKIKPKWRYKR